jgi:hypothetical protein
MFILINLLITSYLRYMDMAIFLEMNYSFRKKSRFLRPAFLYGGFCCGA